MHDLGSKSDQIHDKSLKRRLNELKIQMTFASEYLNDLITNPRHFHISIYNDNPTLFHIIYASFYKTLNILSFGILFPQKTLIKHFLPGEVIFHRGEAFKYVYIIIDGTVELWFGKNAKFKYSNKVKEEAVKVAAPALFGEVSLLERKPRMATAKAETKVTAICIPEDDFLNALESFPDLKSLTVDLKNYYKLPSANTITYQISNQVEGKQGIFTQYRLKSGRLAQAIKVIDHDTFTMVTQKIKPDKTIHYSNGNIQRSLSFYKDILVRIDSHGSWNELNILSTLLLEELNITQTIDRENFSKHGHAFTNSTDILYKEKHLVCACMRVSFNSLKNCIDSGATTLKEISVLTGATTICGSCKPIIKDILGVSKWLFAKVQMIKAYSDERCLLSISPLYNHDLPKFRPGQSITIKVLIDNKWIDRTYTLIKSPKKNTYEILVAKQPGGKFSTWIFEKNTGISLIKISNPFGEFVIPTETSEDVFCFAEEVGIAPFISYLRFLKTKTFLNKVTIFYFISDIINLALPEDIIIFINNHQDIRIEFYIGGPSTLLLADIKKYSASLTYVCGNGKFITNITNLLEKNAFDKRSIFVNKFFQD